MEEVAAEALVAVASFGSGYLASLMLWCLRRLDALILTYMPPIGACYQLLLAHACQRGRRGCYGCGRGMAMCGACAVGLITQVYNLHQRMPPKCLSD